MACSFAGSGRILVANKDQTVGFIGFLQALGS
jgi:hypothetical protein